MRQFPGEHRCRKVISIKLQSNFIEITLRHGCSPVNLLHIFRTPFSRNTSGWLLLNIGYTKNPSQQTFVGLRRLKEMPWHFCRKTISRLPRSLQDIFKKFWKMRNCYDFEKPFSDWEKKKNLMGIFRVDALGTGFNSVFPLNWCVYTTVLNDTNILRYSW